MSDVGIAQVATLAGVSVGTVSNFYNRPELLTPATKSRVHDAVLRLGYVRNSSARDLRVGTSRSVGLLVLDISNPFFTEFIEGVEEVANQASLTITLGSSKEDPAKEASYLDLFLGQRVSGAIVSPAGDISEHLQRFAAQGTPVVLVDDGTSDSDFCAVAVDDYGGGLLAIDQLLHRGSRGILLITGPTRIHQTLARTAGALDRARDADVSVQRIETQAFTAAAARTATREWLRSGGLRGVTGIFAANDLMALGAMEALREEGLRVPDDVALVGYDDISYAAALSPSLTSIRQPSHEMGKEAMRLLLDERAGDDHTHHRTVFKPSLIVRQTA